MTTREILFALAVYEVVAFVYNNYVASGQSANLPFDGVTWILNKASGGVVTTTTATM